MVAMARDGKIEQLKELLASSAPGANQNDALRRASSTQYKHKRDLGLVDLLIAKGLDPNLQLARFTPLGVAATLCDPNFVESMIERGCDVNVAPMDGNTPLMACCRPRRV